MLVLAIHTVATVSASVPFAMIMLRCDPLPPLANVLTRMTQLHTTTFSTAVSSLWLVFIECLPLNLQGSRAQKRRLSWPALQTGQLARPQKRLPALLCSALLCSATAVYVCTQSKNRFGTL